MTQAPQGVSGRAAMDVAQQAARNAGAILMSRLGQAGAVSYKGRGNLVTDVDREAQEEVFAVLSREFPDAILLGEETPGAPVGRGYAWIVDPLDGTRNYVSQIPYFSTVVALALDGEVILGVNYDPCRDEMFAAERGRGAFLNSAPLRVSSARDLEEGVLAVELSYSNEGAANVLRAVLDLWPRMQTARIMGSAALALSYVAAGRTDLFFHHHLEPWDLAAGLLLVEEAGGVVTDRSGRRAGLYPDGLVAANPGLLAQFMSRTEGMAWRQPTHRLA